MSAAVSDPARGEVWSARFDPIVGREKAGERPSLVSPMTVSIDFKAGLQSKWGKISPQTLAAVDDRRRLL